MASKYVPFLLLFLLLPLQTLPTLQAKPYDGYNRYNPRILQWIEEGSFSVRVDEQKISKALWDAGYRIMSVILKNSLQQILSVSSYQHKDFNKTVTIFAPQDKALRFERWISMDYQFAVAKADQEAFALGSISKDSRLRACNYDLFTVTQIPEPNRHETSINNVTIMHWDIYNDGQIIVHGVDDFFRIFPS